MPISDLSKAGFELAPDEVTPRLIISVEGMDGTGKTHLGLTAPGPIAIINTDDGEEGVVEKFQQQRGDIYIVRIEVPNVSQFIDSKIRDIKERNKELDSSGVMEAASKVWDDLTKAYVMALKECRTVIVDTASEAWEILRLARFGRQSNVMNLYGSVNAEFRRTFKTATYSSNANVVFVHKMKRKYVNDIWKGAYEVAGFKEMADYLPQVRLEAYRDEEGVFMMRVLKCRQNPLLLDTEYSNANVIMDGEDGAFDVTATSFPFLGVEVFPETELEDWQ